MTTLMARSGILLTICAALVACGVAPEDKSESLETPAVDPGAEERDTTTVNPWATQDAQCTGYWDDPTSSCIGQCCNGAWYDLGDPGWGHCIDKVSSWCGGCYYQACWGHL